MTPTIQILVSGNDITSDVTARNGLLEWGDSVEESADPFSLTLEDSDNLLEIPQAGVKVEISAGYDGALQRIGSYVVDEVSLEGPPDLISISGSSAPFVSGSGSVAARRSFTWSATTLGDITKSIAARVALTPVIDSALASVTITSEQQTNESDSNFLLRLARKFGGYVKFADGRLVLAKEGAGTGANGTSLTASIDKSEVTKWSVKAGGKTQSFTRVKTKRYDYATASTIETVVDIPKPATVGKFGVSQAGTGVYTPVDFEGANPYASQASAESAAKTTASRIARASRSISLNLPGRLDIIAGAKITLKNFRDGVAGEWLVKSCQHRIQASQGWTMEISAEGI